MSYDSWLSRYRRGEREQVWHELRCLGGRVREPRHYANAQAVCDEMARRARHNVETLVEHLIEQGFNFHTNDCEQQAVVPFAPATASAVSLVEWLEDHIGPVPMTVAAWVRLVGDVWLVGTHSGWPESAQADPLVIEIEGSRYPAASMIANYADQYQQWREGHVDGTEAGLFRLNVAPDRLTKANVSGGPPYGIVLPDPCADGLLVAETAMPFVSYLNWAFGAGGFPGHAAGDGRWSVLASLRDNMLEL